ncbi:MAG: serine protease, partial [Xanthomonadales bacterium]|nr:serine protease [Xanthomonadales bacterium]
RRFIYEAGKLLVKAEVLGSLSGYSAHPQADEWTLLLPQRSRYTKSQSGACTAVPLRNGGLLTAGHCIRSEWLPGSVLHDGYIAAVVWEQVELVASDGANFTSFNPENLWQSVSLIAGRFKPDGPDWALLSSDHDLPGYEITEHNPRIGDTCHINGYPLGLSLRHAASAKVIKPLRETEHFFWLNCQVSNGVSGAPVCNNKGLLAGIVAGETTTENGIYTRVQKIPKEAKS